MKWVVLVAVVVVLHTSAMLLGRHLARRRLRLGQVSKCQTCGAGPGDWCDAALHS